MKESFLGPNVETQSFDQKITKFDKPWLSDV